MRLPLTALLLLLFIPAYPACAYDYTNEYRQEPLPESAVPEVRDLFNLAQQARREGVPMLIAFSTPWCDYCDALEQLVLEPMIVSGEYENRLIIRKLVANDYASVTGFDGRSYLSEDLAMKYRVGLYPTVVFFDYGGREIGKRIVGITVLDYVARDIENTIRALTP